MKLLVAAALLATALAGCTDSGLPSDGPATGAPHDGHVMHTMHAVNFSEVQQFQRDTFTGSFEPQDDVVVQQVNIALGQPFSNFHQYDITDWFVQNADSWAAVEVLAPTDQSIFAWIAASDFKAIWTSDCGECPRGVGQEWEGAIVRTDETFTLNVAYLGRNTATTSYEVDLLVGTSPAWIPSGIVLEVDLPSPGAHVLFEAADGEVPDVMVFGPDDEYMGLLDGGATAEIRLADDSPTGPYVFLPTGHGGFFTLRVGLSEGTPDARFLTQFIDTTGPHAVAEDVELEFEKTARPLQMGVAYFGTLSQDATASMESPNGLRVETGHTGLAGPGIGGFSQTPMGAPDLVPGTYKLQWTDTLNDGSLQVQEFFTYYAR